VPTIKRSFIPIAIQALATLATLGTGLAMLYFCQSWYVVPWASAKTLYPDCQFLWVNTTETLDRREKYGLPDDLVHSLALRAIVVDRSEHVVATFWREAYFEPYPSHGPGDTLFYPVMVWSRVFRIAGWPLTALGLLQAVALVCLVRWKRP
jgi:hypothetical protein